MWVYRTQWRLPADYTCEHCMLQFYYVTGSRCWPPCLPDSKDCIESACVPCLAVCIWFVWGFMSSRVRALWLLHRVRALCGCCMMGGHYSPGRPQSNEAITATPTYHHPIHP